MLIVLCVTSCSSTPTLEVPEEGFIFKLEQRDYREIKGNNGDLRISLDDITRKQVSLRIELVTDRQVLEEKSVRQSDLVNFDYHGTDYHLYVKELKNHLIGQDYAMMVLGQGHRETLVPIKVKQ